MEPIPAAAIDWKRPRCDVFRASGPGCVRRAPGPGASNAVPAPDRGSADERLVAQAVGLVGLGAETPVPVLLVGREVALETPDLRVPLEGQHVGANPVQEPAVVADHDRTPRP